MISDLQHPDSLTEHNYGQYIYSIKRNQYKDELSSIVNLVSSLDLTLLKSGVSGPKGGTPGSPRIRSKFMNFLKKEKIGVKQFGATRKYAYKPVIAFSGSCFSDDFLQVRSKLVDHATSNAQFALNPKDVNIQYINIRLPNHLNHPKGWRIIQAT